MAGISIFGAYLPWRRLERSAIYAANRWFAPGLRGLAKGQRTFASWDEDAVTMAVEAARDCLGALPREGIHAVMLASTSLSYADRQNAGIVKEALALPDNVGTLDVSSSQKAGSSTLIQAFHAADAVDAQVLVVASEKRRAKPASEDELLNGDGAASFLVSPQDGVARLVGTHSITVDFVDHFRTEGREFDYGWESRWIREEGFEKIGARAVKTALERFSIPPARVSQLLVGIPARGIAAAFARRLGIPPDAAQLDLGDTVGHVGTAQPLLLLAHALESAVPGDILVVVGFGQGADVLIFEVTPEIARIQRGRGVSGHLARGVSESNYLKFLAWNGNLQLELGKRAEFDQKPVPTALYRNRKAVMGLIGSRSLSNGAVQFPRSEISVAGTDAASDPQEDYALADRIARVVTFTADHLTFTPDPPAYYGMVEFEGGGRMLAEFADVQPAAVSVGAPMQMMFRIKAVDDRTGFVKYFWKAVSSAGSI